MKLPAQLRIVAEKLTELHFQCFLVGGAVRDMLLKKKVTDYDIATDARPADVMKIFRRVVPTGLKHGTVTVLMGKERYEVTTFRTEGEYSDHRRPDNVSFTGDIDDDLKRRDFTINAMAYAIEEKRLHDPFGGKEDLERKLIRAIGNPDERFSEDALRMLRAARFAVQLHFVIDAQTLQAIGRNASLITHVSPERIRDELINILESDSPSEGIELIRHGGLLGHILPELAEGTGVAQPSLHCFDVYTHSLASCDGAPAENLPVRLAALFHDIGKPRSVKQGKRNEPCFHNHETLGAKMTEKILQRLRFPNRIIEKVTHLVTNHMFNYDGTWKDAAVRRFIKRVGIDEIDDLFALRRADQFGMCRRPARSPVLEELSTRIDALLREPSALTIRELVVNGDDLIRELGIGPGREIGLLLDFLLESVLDDPGMNERETLLTAARRFYRERLHPAD